ncbi:MAG: PhoH family protein [Gammaproteobacteria bacterium]|nr:PhoH family protein [Gammaproteobacteria bacterium]
MNPETSTELTLEPLENERLANLCGQFDEHLRLIERRLGVEISNRGNEFSVTGNNAARDTTARILRRLYATAGQHAITPADVHLQLQENAADGPLETEPDEFLLQMRRGMIRARGTNQRQYLRNIETNDISFGIGPAGTGKTYLAVAAAVAALEKDQVRRLCLVRPAVEAGEKLGFLPGDMAQKIDPYLRPLYDALYEMLGFERVAKLIERNVIEVAPLAFMRGRTLNDAFIILDEAQNTTIEQMKMFLTRLGFGSKAVITGDVTQIDLPRGRDSGLKQAIAIVRDVPGISFTFFKSQDVVRHALVGRILDAYEAFEKQP